MFLVSSVANPIHFFGSRSGSADPVLKIRIRIRIRMTQKRPDPTGSGSYLDVFLIFNKTNIFYGIFFSKSKHLMTLKIKDKKLLGRNCILYIFI